MGRGADTLYSLLVRESFPSCIPNRPQRDQRWSEFSVVYIWISISSNIYGYASYLCTELTYSVTCCSSHKAPTHTYLAIATQECIMRMYQPPLHIHHNMEQHHGFSQVTICLGSDRGYHRIQDLTLSSC
jgi:hypothetical protein